MSAARPLFALLTGLALASAAAAQPDPAITDLECQGPVHGRTRDVGDALTVTMVSGSVAPGTRGVVCVPWTDGTRQGLRLAREIVAESAWSDQVRTRVTKRSATRLVPDATVTFERTDRPGSVQIDAEGERAGVYSGGTWIGGTPLTLPLPQGTYTFEVRRAGYEPAPLAVEVRAGVPSTERVTLVPLAPGGEPVPRGGALRITTTPAGATVWIDGVLAGVTPLTASALSAGPHEIEARTDSLAAAPQTVELGTRPQTLAVALAPEAGLLLLQTRQAGQVLLVDAVAAPATPVLISVASGTRRVSAQGSAFRSLAAPIEVLPGLVTVALVSTEAAQGWLDVNAPPDATVRVGGSDVGRGALRLRVPAGEHTVTVVGADGTEMAREVAHVEDGAAVVVAAGGRPPTLIASRDAGGAVAVVDRPDAPAAAPPVALPIAALPTVARPATGPATALVQAPAQPSVSAGPTVWSTGTSTVDPSCTATAVGELATEGENRLYGGFYMQARACYVRLAQLDPSKAAFAQQRVLDIAGAIAALEIRPAEAVLVPQYHTQMLNFARTGEPARLLSTAGLLFQALPNDPAGLVILRRSLASPVALPESDIRIATIYVPGADQQTPTDAALMSVSDPPGQGFRLAATEITNRAFVAFLNSLEVRATRPFVIRDLRFIQQAQERYADGSRQRTRVVFRVVEGAEDQPAVDATWAGAAAFATWAGGRLPTAAEWEWAARLGRRGAVSTAAHLRSTPPARAPLAVGSFPADALGLSDMYGNVWEWIAPDTPTSPNLLRAAGGSYTTPPDGLERAMFRSFGPNDHDNQTGWRVLFSVSD